MTVQKVTFTNEPDIFLNFAEITIELDNRQIEKALMIAQNLQETTAEHIDGITIKFVPVEVVAEFTQNVKMVIKEK